MKKDEVDGEGVSGQQGCRVVLYSSVESTSRYEMRVLKVMTDHETTNRKKPRNWHKHGKITKHVVQ